MDSKNIHISYLHNANYIEWEMNNGSEWIYIGTDEKFEKDKVTELINSFFEEEKLYLITDRHSSCLIEKNQAVDNMLQAINEYNPALSSTDFRKVIELNKIGVLRKGHRKD